MLVVEKIGGTSMSKFQDVLKNIVIGKRSKKNLYNRIFVVSAYADVTNWLLEHKKTGEPGIYAKFVKQECFADALYELADKLKQINRQFKDVRLDLKKAAQFLTSRIEQTKSVLDSMAEVLASGYVSKESITLAAREILASIGEAHSAFNSANILNNNGVHSTFVDLSGFHDSEFLTIDERIQKELVHIDFSKTIPIVTGYTKGTEGIMREFDRGYSEVTFSKIAVLLNVDEAIIHKEYHLSSADPKIVGVEKSIPVGNTNYDVADQLADVGMEAIHPKASKPIELAGINIRIKNTFEPDHPGTLISKAYVGPESKVEIITGTRDVVVVEIHDPSMVGTVGFDQHIMGTFHKHQVSYIMKCTNANSISMVVWDKPKINDPLFADLRQHFELVTVKEVAVLCAIGSNIAKPGVLVKAAQALAENKINIDCISQSLRQVNMQFVIERESFEKAVVALNDALCVN